MMPFNLVLCSVPSLRTFLGVLAAFILVASPAAGQSVSVTVGDTAAVAGDTVAVPVSVSALDQAADVTAYGFELAFSGDSLSYVSVDTTNTLSGEAGLTVDDNPDVPRVGAFGSTPINDESDGGVLIRVRFAVAEPGTTQVALEDLQFNSGSPPADPARPTFSVTGTPPNAPPVAAADQYETTEDQTLQVDGAAEGVLGNDSDPNGDTLTANLGPSVSNGSLTFSGDGTFEYTPDSGFTGDDTFRYAATDPDGAVDSTTVTISVVPPNTAPTVTSIADQTIPEDSTTGPLSVTIGDNETDPADLSVRTASSDPSLVPDDSISLGGSGADRTITVTPAPNAFGTADITTTVSDGADSTQQQFELAVQSVNDPPVATDDKYRAVQDDTFRVTDASRGLLANDTDVDDDTLSAIVVDSVSNGALSLNSTGTFSYAPDAAFTGEDAFTYEVTDGRGGRDTATTAFTVLPSDSVSVQSDSVVTTTGDTAHVPITVRNLDQAADVTAYSFDLQFDDDALTYAGFSTDSTLSGNAGFTVDENAEAARIGAFGDMPLDSVATEGTLLRLQFVVAAEGTTTVALNDLQFNDGVPPARPSRPQFTVTSETEALPNRAPRASDDRYDTVKDEPLSITQPSRGILRNDTDPEGDSLTTSLAAGPENGSLTFRGDGTFDYAPDSAFTGRDSFRYRVSDPQGLQDSASVEIAVGRDSSVAVTLDDIRGSAGDTLTVPIRLNRLDQVEDVTSYGFDVGLDTTQVAYVGFQSSGTLSGKADFTVDGNPDLPRIGGFGSTPLNDVSSQGVMLKLEFRLLKSGNSDIVLEELQFNEGSPPPNPSRPSATISTNPVDRPTALPDSFSTPKDSALTVGAIGVLENDFNPKGDLDSLNVSVVSDVSDGTLSLDADGSFEYDPNPDFDGEDGFAYEATDKDGAKDTASVQITVQPADGSPTTTVWAGDTNNDSTVDQADVLPLGLYWGSTGPSRSETGCTWQGQSVSTWTPEAATYADANGDGTVDQADVLCVGLNWGETRDTTGSSMVAGVNKSEDSQGQLVLRHGGRNGSALWVELHARETEPLMGVAAELSYDLATVSVENVERGAKMGQNALLQSRAEDGTLGIGVSRAGASAKSAASGPVVRVKLRAETAEPDVRLREATASTVAGTTISLATSDETLRAPPEEVLLEAPAPNPVRHQATLRYGLPEAQQVRLTVYDVLGRKVRTLVDEEQKKGRKEVVIDASSLSSGAYFYRLEAGKTVKTNRLTVVR